MGASLDPYELHSKRSTLDFVEGLCGSPARPVPVPVRREGQAAVGRHVGHDAGLLADHGHDAGRGLLPRHRLGHLGLQGDAGLRQDDGHTVAKDEDHALIEGFNLSRFARYELTGEKGRGVGRPLKSWNSSDEAHPLPHQRSAADARVRYAGRGAAPCPIRTPAPTSEWADYVFNRKGAAGGQAGVVVSHRQRHLVHRRARHPRTRSFAPISSGKAGP